MKPNRKRSILCSITMALYIGLVAYLCFANFHRLPEVPNTFLGIPVDKIVHFWMFFPFPILAYLAYDKLTDTPLKAFAALISIASIGCVFAPDEGSDYPTLFKKADKALYNVKQNGKHGYRIYRDMETGDGREQTVASDIANMSMILGERNRAKGAYCLSLEDFRVVFQFLSRVNVNYKRSVWIVLFSVSSKEDSELPRETIKEVFRSSLRQSDVVTHSSRNQYMILLLEMSPFNIEVVIDRIMNKWNACSELTGFELTYELDLLK